MKLIVTTDNLQKKLLLINHAISTKSQLPILSHVLLETKAPLSGAKEGNLTLSGTDLEIGIETTIPADISEEGTTTVPAKLFSELINNLPQEKISLETSNGSLIITSKKTRSVLQTMKRDEFPTLFEEKGEEIFNIKPEILQKDFHMVVFAASMETTRPALSGVYMKQTEQGFVFVATDGYRLSLKTLNEELRIKNQGEGDTPLLVPARVIKEVLSLKEEGEIGFFVSGQNNQVLFSQDDTILVGRLIEAEFPNYQKIIPTDASSRISFDREELQKAVKTCAIFARESANIIKFAMKTDRIIVSAKSPSFGENTVEVEANLKGEENEIAFNGKYLLDVLGNIEEENLVFEMTGPLNPGVFKIENDSTFLHLIMPIRTQG